MNSFFATLGLNLANSLPPPASSNGNNVIGCPVKEESLAPQLTGTTVSNTIKANKIKVLKIKKSTGPDNIQPKLLKLQSATKWVETLRPKWTFWRFPDFKRGKDNVSSPIPSMQCCATVRATFRKQETSQLWMEGTGEGCGFLCFRSYPIWVQCLNNFVADCSKWFNSSISSQSCSSSASRAIQRLSAGYMSSKAQSCVRESRQNGVWQLQTSFFVKCPK